MLLDLLFGPVREERRERLSLRDYDDTAGWVPMRPLVPQQDAGQVEDAQRISYRPARVLWRRRLPTGR
jgi:hypothetical protein